MNVEENVGTYFFVGNDAESAKNDKEWDGGFDARDLHINGEPKTVVLTGDHEVDLFGGNAFEIGDGFDFGGPRPFGVAFTDIETINPVFGCAFLSEYCFF